MRSKTVTPAALDGLGQTPGQPGRVERRAVGREGGPSTPSAPRSWRASAASSQRRSSSPMPARGPPPPRPGPPRLRRGPGRHHRAALGEVAVDPLGRRRRPTSSTVACMARRMAWRGGRTVLGPARRRRWRRGPSTIRRCAPRRRSPATSASSTATRSDGSAAASECAVHSPVKPAPDHRHVDVEVAGQRGRGGTTVLGEVVPPQGEVAGSRPRLARRPLRSGATPPTARCGASRP